MPSNSNKIDHKANQLIAVFDLNVVPPTFDVIPFLVSAEIHRLQANLKNIRFAIVPSKSSQDKIDIYDRHNLDWRVRQIVIPATSLIPSCTSLMVFESREQAREELAVGNFNIYPDI